MGLFDLASPLLTWIDGAMVGWLPSTIRLLFWALVTGFVSMLLYRLTSNQKRLGEIKGEMAALRKQISEFDGPMSEMWSLTGRNLTLALRQLWVTLLPALLASIPVIFLLVWVSNTFGTIMPQPGAKIAVEALASHKQSLPQLHWKGGEAQVEGDDRWIVAWPGPDATMKLSNVDDEALISLPTAAPVGIVHQRRWWNALLGNPAGYLPSPGPVDTVLIGVPAQEFLPFGPAWLRGWMPLFFTVVIAVSLLLKVIWRIH
ncbi:MAG: hypothetical protein AAF637_21330 [Pseudomonadota bacterium]